MVNYNNRSNNSRGGYNQQRNNNDRIRCDLLEEIGVIGQRQDGWTREVNIVSWNGAAAKVDVRDWDPDHNRMSKGITLLEEEAENLVKVLAGRYGFRLTNNTAVITRHDGQASQQTQSVPTESGGELYETGTADDAPDAPFTAEPAQVYGDGNSEAGNDPASGPENEEKEA